MGFWTRSENVDAEISRVAECLNSGMSIRETAKETGLSKGQVERLKTKAVREGRIKPDKPGNKLLDE